MLERKLALAQNDFNKTEIERDRGKSSKPFNGCSMLSDLDNDL